MKTIKIWFSGMTGNFNPDNNFITNILKKHFNIVLTDQPDYLFYSVNSTDYLKYDCIRIFYTPENLVPDFNICDCAIGFHYISFGDRYIRFPIYLVNSFMPYDNDDYRSDLERAQKKHLTDINKINEKNEFCAFVYSNAEGALCRKKIFEALSEYKIVNSGGQYLNNVGGPISNKLEFQKKHRFVIAFENTSTSGYTTEKIVHAFSANAIPIYWGNPDIDLEFNEKAFINCHKFGLTEKGEINVIKKIVDVVIYINEHPEEYEKMIRVKSFADDNDVEVQVKKFEKYLVSIFEQDYKDCGRRNKFYWGERYERKQRVGMQYYLFLRKFIPVRDFIKKILRR